MHPVTLKVALLSLACLTTVSYANVAPQAAFEKLTNAQNWTWQTFNNFPKTANESGLKKDPNRAANYYLERSVIGYPNASITAYGSQAAPNEVMFYSGGWGTTDTNRLLKLANVLNVQQLTKLQSNCNFGKIQSNYTGKDAKGKRYIGSNYIDYQTIYKWSRPNSTPLYVVALQGGGSLKGTTANQGVNSTILLTPYFNQLNTIIAHHGWHKDNKGKSVSCTFG